MSWSTDAVVFFVVEILIYTFHLSMLFLMFAKRQSSFKGPFFNILRLVLVADMMSFAGFMFTRKLALIPIVKTFMINNFYVASFYLAFSNFFTAIQYVGHVLLAFNRFTIICFPFKHDKIWKNQWYIWVNIVISFLTICWKLHEPAYFLFNANNAVSMLSYVNEDIVFMHNAQSVALFFTTTCLAAIFNFLSFIKFLIHKQNDAFLNVNERNLLFVSCIIFIAQLFRIAYNANKLLFSPGSEIDSLFNAALPYLSDIFAWSGSISLLVLSSSTRKAYKLFYLCKSKVANANHLLSSN